MHSDLDVSIIFSTYNRSAGLRETLEAMCALDRDGLDVEFVVIDNNSTDQTGQVIDSFVGRLPLRRLFEPRPGKNCALNLALATVKLGEIVVFTDDDVAPHVDWLKQIVSACERWPNYNVFGGKVELIWPAGANIPSWASENAKIREMGFGDHDRGVVARGYEGTNCPIGANFWVRRSVLDGGVRFDESVGPSPSKRFRMGSETEFLFRMAAGGNRPFYVPTAVVGHQVERKLLVPKNMLQRAVRSGKGKVHTTGYPEPDLLRSNPWRWRFRRLIAMAGYFALRVRAQMHSDESIRMRNGVEAIRFFEYHREALSLSWSTTELTKAENRKQCPLGVNAAVENSGQLAAGVQGSEPKTTTR